MSFQNDLKRYKARHYNTTKEIGSLLGVSQRTAYRLLSGEKVPTKAEAEYFASILAKRDPDLLAAAKAVLPSGVSDDFFKSCLKQHRDTLSDMQMSIKSIQAEQSAQQAAQQAELSAIKDAKSSNDGFIINLSLEVEKSKKSQRETETEFAVIWSELQAQKAEIDRLSQAKPSLWNRIINFVRGEK